jgi:hypothetical protein
MTDVMLFGHGSTNDIYLRDRTSTPNFSVSQGAVQTSLNGASGKSGFMFNESWMQLWDHEGVPAGMFDERMLMWINTRLGTSYTNLPQAQQALATSLDVANFDSIGTFTP